MDTVYTYTRETGYIPEIQYIHIPGIQDIYQGPIYSGYLQEIQDTYLEYRTYTLDTDYIT